MNSNRTSRFVTTLRGGRIEVSDALLSVSASTTTIHVRTGVSQVDATATITAQD